jgi:multidrug efflux pump subunit AcrB
MSIGFAMIVSFLSSQTLVPVISVWMLKASKNSRVTEGFAQHAVMALDKKEEAEGEQHRAEEGIASRKVTAFSTGLR